VRPNIESQRPRAVETRETVGEEIGQPINELRDIPARAGIHCRSGSRGLGRGQRNKRNGAQ
jgi:hypothetical protein